jgi:hypothetical protein
MGGVREILTAASMNAYWWPDAAIYQTFVHNRMPNMRLNGKSPYEKLYGVKPSYDEIHIWGCICFAFIPEEERPKKKLAPRRRKCKLIGIAKHKKAYKLLALDDNKIIYSRDVLFSKNDLSNFFDHCFKKKINSKIGSIPKFDNESSNSEDETNE